MMAKSSEMLKVVVIGGSGRIETRDIEFTGNEILVGRRDPCEPEYKPGLELEDPRVSRRQAVIHKKADKYFIQDLNSKRNTIVDGEGIAGKGEVELVAGAVIQTGDTIWAVIPSDWLFIQCGDAIICASCLAEMSYCLFHCGTPIVGPIVVRNLGDRRSSPMRLRLELIGYSEPCEVEIPAVEPGSRISFGAPAIRLHPEKLKNQVEVAYSRLDAEIVGRADCRTTKDVTILGFWDWPFNESARKALAGFVSPRNPVIENIVIKAQKKLKKATGVDTFRDLLRTGHADAQRLIVKTLYDFLKDERNIFYTDPKLKTDKNGQKTCQTIRPPHVIFPSESSKDGKGTCLDLALLMAGCMENVELCPVIVLIGNEEGIPEHSFAGCWIGSTSRYRPIIGKEMLCSEAASGNLLIVECTGFAQGANDNKGKLCFAEAVGSAMKQLNAANNICAVDIHPLRPHYGCVTPMDYLFDPVVDGVIEIAKAFARHKRREAVETTYLFYGFIIKKGKVIKWLLDKVDLDADTVCSVIEELVEDRHASTEPVLTRNFSECKRLAGDFAWQDKSAYVREQDLLWALLTTGRDSNTFQAILKKLKVDIAQFGNLLSQKYPRPNMVVSCSSFVLDNSK